MTTVTTQTRALRFADRRVRAPLGAVLSPPAERG
jgi:hypothetical protein